MVLVAALALLVGFLIPVMSCRPGTAFRLTCGTNLSGIGKAMSIYANDYGDNFPYAGGRGSSWASRTPDWTAKERRDAFGLRPDGTSGQASISASLYLLVKYSGVSPERFVCPGEKKVRKFDPARYHIRDTGLAGVWDFGPNPPKHCSYAYHMVYSACPLATSGDPGFAVAADRNPWIDSPFARAGDFAQFKPDFSSFKGTTEQAHLGNAAAHARMGLNVLFRDGHVEFALRSYCALDDDNIYTVSRQETVGDPLGIPPKLGSQPANPRDSLLVNDPPAPNKREPR